MEHTGIGEAHEAAEARTRGRAHAEISFAVELGVLDNGQMYLLGTIKGTKADNRSAALRIEVTYKDKPPRTSPPYPTRGGYGHTRTIGWQTLPDPAPAMLLGDDVTQVRVSDCLMVKGLNADLRLAPEGCGDSIRIYPQ